MRRIIYWLTALICFAGMIPVILCFAGGGEKSLSPDIVILGDSIFGQSRGENSIDRRLGERLGAEVLNGALGGTSMARQNVRRYMDFGKEDDLSMASLAKAVVSGDFSLQQSVRSTQPATWYYEDTVDVLDQVDFRAVKILILAYGINDYHHGISVEDPEAAGDETTYAGALRGVIGQLRSAYPKLRILLVTPTYSWYVDRNRTCEEFDGGGGFLEKYVNKELEIAEELGVEILDLYHDYYPHETWEDYQNYTIDGVHPNDRGMDKIADTIAEYLR